MLGYADAFGMPARSNTVAPSMHRRAMNAGDDRSRQEALQATGSFWSENDGPAVQGRSAWAAEADQALRSEECRLETFRIHSIPHAQSSTA